MDLLASPHFVKMGHNITFWLRSENMKINKTGKAWVRGFQQLLWGLDIGKWGCVLFWVLNSRRNRRLPAKLFKSKLITWGKFHEKINALGYLNLHTLDDIAIFKNYQIKWTFWFPSKLSQSNSFLKKLFRGVILLFAPPLITLEWKGLLNIIMKIMMTMM